MDNATSSQRAAEPPALTRELRTSHGWTLREFANGEVSVCAPSADPGMMYLKNGGTLPQRLLYTFASSLLDGDTLLVSEGQATPARGSSQQNENLVERLLNADSTALPAWASELMHEAAAQLGSLTQGPAPT